MFMLRNRAPKRFDAARGMNAVDKMVLARHRKQWRKEWEREQALADAEHEREQGDDLYEKIGRMHRNWYCSLSPAARATYRAFRTAEDEDRSGAWMSEDDAEPVTVAETEYEEFFGEGRDRRAQVAKLADMRVWEDADGEEER